VWAAVSRGAEVLDVFSLDTGNLVATVETCNRVFDLGTFTQVMITVST
jgi:hypothetical protein